MDNFVFSPSDGFLNTSSYPDPASGTAARTQLQSLHTQTRNFINEQVVPAINNAQTAISSLTSNMATAQGDISALHSSLSALSEALSALSTSLTTSSLNVVVGSKTYNITVSNGNVVANEV